MNVPPWHAEPWAGLQARRQRDALPHAMLFCGPEGLRKRAFATRFIHGLLCQRPDHGEACRTCRSCLLLAAGTHPDLVSLSFGFRKDGTLRSEIIVDQIRQLSARLAMASQFGGWQIAMIDPADAMNPSAANALLKTLEEPAERTLLVLLADAPWRLPQTIRSRCQRFEFKQPTRDDSLAWLQAEQVAEPTVALAAAGGNPGLAKRLADEGALERRSEVRDDLAALASGRGELMDVVRRWLDEETTQRLWFAAHAAADEARAQAVRQRPPLSSELDAVALGDWYAAANRTREALRGPLRQDLLLLQLLAQWR